MTPETRQRGLMDLNTFNWKKVFSIALQIFCSAVFLFYLLWETLIYFLFFAFGSSSSEEQAYPFWLEKTFEAMISSGYFSLIIANIIFAISFIASFFLKCSRWLCIILKYILKFSAIFTSIAGLGLMCLFIPGLFLVIISSKILSDWVDYLLLFIFFLYPTLIFLQPYYFRHFIFYHTPIVRQRKLLWLNIVPLGIFLLLIFFFSARISDAIKYSHLGS